MKKFLNRYIVLAIPVTLLLILFIYLIFRPVPFSNNFLRVVTPFLSTFFGASFAFYLNNNKDINKKDDERLSALRVALFTVAQQQNALDQLWKLIREWEHRKDKFINMRPHSLPNSEHLRQDLSALSFIIPVNPGLLMELTVEDERFAQTMSAVKRHAEFHVLQVQPALDKSGLHRKTSSLAEIEKALGSLVYGTSRVYAQEIFEHLVPTRKSLGETMPKIFEFAKSIYPGETFLKTFFDADTEPEISGSALMKVPDYSPPLSGKYALTEVTLRL